MIKFSQSPLTHTGKVRQANEDAYASKIIDDRTSVFVVCDGMGGHVGGAVASQKSVECIVDSIAGADLSNYKKAISNAFIFANDQVYAESLNNPSLKGMGTTGVVLVVKNDSCYIGHVGDSRIYLMSDSQLHRLTKDHSFVQQLVDKGELDDEMAENHPMKNRILRAIGIAPEIETEVCQREIKVKKGDCFLLCSDGLNGMINDKKIKSIMASDSSLDEKAQRLVDAALEAGGKDNITAFLIHIDDSPHSTSDFVSYNPSSGSKDFSQTQVGGTHEGKNKASRFSKSQKIMLASSALLTVVLAVFLVVKPFKNDTKDTGENTVKPEVVKEQTPEIQKITVPDAQGITPETKTNTTTSKGETTNTSKQGQNTSGVGPTTQSQYEIYLVPKGAGRDQVLEDIAELNPEYKGPSGLKELERLNPCLTEKNSKNKPLKADQKIKYRKPRSN